MSRLDTAESTQSTDPLHAWPLDRIAARCAAETSRFFGGASADDRYCHELFRRALCEGDQRAWDHLHARYQAEVAGWVQAQESYRVDWDALEDLGQEAFASFARAVTADRFERFPNLRALLGYLKACVHTAVVDRARQQQRLQWLELPIHLEDTAASTPGRVLGEELRRQLWQRIRERLADERELIVMSMIFVFDFKPRHIAERYPEHFANVTEIYRIKRNVIERLSRDPGIQQIWQAWDDEMMG